MPMQGYPRQGYYPPPRTSNNAGLIAGLAIAGFVVLMIVVSLISAISAMDGFERNPPTHYGPSSRGPAYQTTPKFRVWLMRTSAEGQFAIDMPGLLMTDTPGLSKWQQPFTQERSAVAGWRLDHPDRITLADVVRNAKPTVLIGVTAQTGPFAGEVTRFGLPGAGFLSGLEAVRGREGVRVGGLMVLPPCFEDPERARPYFRRLRSLHDRARAAGLLEGRELSMGMSHDFEVAIEEGATIVRVGSAIFGTRAPRPAAG